MRVKVIPEEQYQEVALRHGGRCLRCGGAGTDFHHRRSRRVRDEHTHHPCNGIWLCRTCHSWVHRHPALAQDKGWIVSQWVAEPGTKKVKAFTGDWLDNTCRLS